MESFFRSIFYIDYYEGQNRICSVGYLRWKKRADMHTIEIQIKDAPKVRGEYAFEDSTSRMPVFTLYLEEGLGSSQATYQEFGKEEERYLRIENREIFLNRLQGLVMELGNDRKLKIEIALPYSNNETESKREIPVVVEMAKEEKEETYEIMKPLHGNKWEQLCTSYPVVHPFNSEQVFLSIKPKDFVILQGGYQKLVHNSFLLHGFYNYHHMILGRISEEEDAPYYIGVPGVYYTREKQAAQMFGFVGFESTENPVQNGSFGYYMIEVEI